MIDEYLKAKKAGEKEFRARLARGEYPYLPALDDILPDNGTMPSQHLGLMEIPVHMIAGTKTRGRQNSFAPDFMPLLEPDTEFAMKWANLYNAQMDEGFTSPIKVYEYLHRFYVQEGNKRVSVSRFLDMPVIMADVTRIIPSADDLNAHPEYREFLEFYRVCPIYDIECTQPGSYAEIAELLGRSLPSASDQDASKSGSSGKAQGTVGSGSTAGSSAGSASKVWPEELQRSLISSFWRFSEVFSALKDKVTDMPEGDAFVVYLRIYVRDALAARPDKELQGRIRRIRREFSTAKNSDKVALVESSDDAVNAGGLITRTGSLITKPGSVIGKVLPVKQYSVKHPLKAAFIYDRCPEDSNWTYNHEVGRIAAEDSYGGIVRTERFIVRGGDVTPDGEKVLREKAGRTYRSFEEAVSAAADWGAEVVFTTSVRQMNDTLRAAIEYEDIIFLNCSINLAHQAVRTYYAKLYEAKFLAGLIAGVYASIDGTHRVGYCSDYPIYGTIAGINAFAIGAAMTDPEVKIVLDWSGRQDNNWWWSMVDQGIHVISAVDSLHNTDGSNAFGLCYVEKVAPGEGTDLSGMCRITNLASPVWKWGKLYEIILKTILEGTYHASSMDKKDQATNYWWGMISGVVDIELGEELPSYTRQLVQILRSDIENGRMNPFDGELRSQNGLVRHADDELLTSKDVITMDWLNENVIGEIPDMDALTDTARATVSVSGVKER